MNIKLLIVLDIYIITSIASFLILCTFQGWSQPDPSLSSSHLILKIRHPRHHDNYCKTLPVHLPEAHWTSVHTAKRRDVLGCTSPSTKRFPEAWEISRGQSPRDFFRAEVNLEVGGDVQPKTSQLEAVYSHSLIINPFLRMYQEMHPYRAMSSDSVKINTSLVMRRECSIFTLSVGWY